MAVADVRGPDVASYQHPYGYSINWGQAHASGNASFAFVKATEGTNYTNPYFGRDWAGTAAEGIVHGAYHFARPAWPTSTAVAQAHYFVNTAGTMHRRGELPGVLDLEVTGGLSPSQLIAWTDTWLRTVRSLTGRTPILYTYPYFWTHAMANTTAFSGYPLWIASYGANPPRLGGWSHWTFWQYSDNSSVPGVPGSGSVDMSVFNGSLAQLQAMANGATSHWRPSGHNPIGNLDIAGQWGVGMRIIGWAIDPDTVNPDYVHVYLDGSFLRRLWAGSPRPDIGDLWPGDGPNHGYDTTLQVKPGSHQVCVYAINLGYGDSNPRFPCRTVDVQPATIGRIDIAGAWSDGMRVIGWAIDSSVDGPARVKVTLDGNLVTTTTANVTRSDIGDIYGVYGPNHGWDVILPNIPAGSHEVCAYATPFTADGGKSLGCKTVQLG